MDMKRVIKYFVLLPFISACVQEPVTEPAPDVTESSSVYFEAQIASPEDQPESKTALGEMENTIRIIGRLEMPFQ